MEIVLSSLGQRKEIPSSEGEIKCHLEKGGRPKVPTECKLIDYSKQLLPHPRNTDWEKG